MFIKNILTERKFRVKVGNTLSTPFVQENGVPQGSVLSVTLFAIAINGVIAAAGNTVKTALYVDDLVIYYTSSRLALAERHLQLAVCRIENWASSNGFRFSSPKTQCVHFCRRRTCIADPDIYL